MSNNKEQSYPPVQEMNFRIEVSVDSPMFRTVKNMGKQWRWDAENVRDSILRHVDGINNAAIQCDLVCIFCHELWEIEEIGDNPDCPKGIPLCCEEAQQAWHIHTAPIPVDTKKG